MTTQSKRARRARRQDAAEARRVEGRAPGLSRGAVRTLAVAFLLSGSAGLIHEVVWTRRLGFLFGVSEMAVATVLAAFMGGLAIGSWWLGSRPWSDGRRIYAWLEIGIGVAALVVPLALDLVEPLYGWLWRRTHLSFATFSVLRFVVAGAILLAPTIMMGATFPVLAAYARTREGGRLSPAWLYTLNLVGAMLGVAAAGFVLLPALGMRATIALGALVNVGVGLWVLRLPAAPARARPRRRPSWPRRRRRRHAGFSSAPPSSRASSPWRRRSPGRASSRSSSARRRTPSRPCSSSSSWRSASGARSRPGAAAGRRTSSATSRWRTAWSRSSCSSRSAGWTAFRTSTSDSTTGDPRRSPAASPGASPRRSCSSCPP